MQPRAEIVRWLFAASVMRAEDALQLPFADLMYGDLSPLAYDTRFGLSLSGHSAVEPNSSWLSQVVDWVHLSAAALRVGVLVLLAVVARAPPPELRRSAFLGFSRLATLLIGALVAVGVYLNVQRLPNLSDPWSEDYGQVLLVAAVLLNSAPPARPEPESGVAARASAG